MMKAKIASGALALLALLLVSQVTQGQDALSGAEVFRQNCMACHGPTAGGTHVAPRINDVFTRLNETQIREVLRTGRKVMPVMAHLEPADVDAVLAFLKGNAKAKAPEATAPGALAKLEVPVGKTLFQSNCASCHSTQVVKDPKPGPASLVNVTRRFNAKEIENLMRNGPCYMPSFNHFTAAEAQSVITFLKTLENDDAPLSGGGCAGDGACAMVKKAAQTAPGKDGPAKASGCDMSGKGAMGGCDMSGKKAMDGCDMGGKGGCDMGAKTKKAGCDMGGKGGCDMGAKTKKAMPTSRPAAKDDCGGCDMGKAKAPVKKAAMDDCGGCDMEKAKAPVKKAASKDDCGGCDMEKAKAPVKKAATKDDCGGCDMEKAKAPVKKAASKDDCGGCDMGKTSPVKKAATKADSGHCETK